MEDSQPNLTEIAGVNSAINALAVSDDGKKAFFYDPQQNAIVSLEVDSGERKTLNWYNKEYRRRKWLRYCMFHWKTEEHSERLSMLLYDQHRKAFFMVVFALSCNEFLVDLKEQKLRTPNIRTSKLAYAAQKDGNRIEIVFYERYGKEVRFEQGNSDSLRFLYCVFNCAQMRLETLKPGTLPNGRWELPFIANSKLHFLQLDQTTISLAAIHLSSEEEENGWDLKEVLADPESGLTPTKRAIWCNAWQKDQCVFAVARRAQPSGVCCEVWLLDMRSFAWHKTTLSTSLPRTAVNFALRIAGGANSIVLHCDTDRTTATLYKFERVQLLAESDNESDDCKENNVAKEYADVICPICLDTYTDPRTLLCGHSVCFACLSRMREVGRKTDTVKCPTCRKPTKIPEEGLPTNYGLQEAIEMMTKVELTRLSGLRCSQCRAPGLETDLWVCVGCEKLRTPDDEVVPDDSCFTICAKCALKDHDTKDGHALRSMEAYKFYCEKIKAAKSDLDARRQTMLESLEQFVQQQFRDRFAEAFDNVLTTDEDFKVLKLLSDEQIEAIVRTNSDRLSQLDDLLRSELGAMVQAAVHNAVSIINNDSTCSENASDGL